MLYPSCILLNQRSKRQIISSLELDTDAKAHDAMTAVGRFLPVIVIQCTGQIQCKRLVKSNANGWSIAM